MNTLRHYFISDDLDDLDLLEEQLESSGVENPQIHVLSNDDLGVANHVHLHAVQSLLKSDIIHSGGVGAVIGVIGAALTLSIAYFMGLTEFATGWVPFIFLAVVIFGFCTWEGGMIGMDKPNHHYERFQAALDDNKHVFIVDLEPDQEDILARLLQEHPRLDAKGTEMGGAHWLLALRHNAFAFIDRNLYSFSQTDHKP